MKNVPIIIRENVIPKYGILLLKKLNEKK